jgi:hypothetical protein
MFTTVCPGCDSSLNAPDTLKGKKVKCKKCGEPFVARPADATEEEPLPKTVKTPGIAPPQPRKPEDEDLTEEIEKLRAKKRRLTDNEDDTEIMEAKVVDEDEEEKSPRQKSKQKKGTGKHRKEKKSPAMLFVLIAVGAVVLLGGGSVGAYYAFFKEEKKTDPQATGGTTGNTTGSRLPGGGPGLGTADSGWVEVADAEGKLRIKFPKQPKKELKAADETPYGNFNTMKYELAGDGELFGCEYFSLPDRMGKSDEQLLDDYIQYAQKKVQEKNAEVHDLKRITYSGHSGFECSLTVASDKAALRLFVRAVIAGDRVISLISTGANESAHRPRSTAFFDSLVIEK